MKRSLDELAVLGGTPAFGEPLHVGRPNLGDRDLLLNRIGDILDSRWLTNSGRFLREFEDRVASVTGARRAVAVANATLGLQLTAKALGVTGRVAVPSFTFIGSVTAFSWIGIEPVFIDIEASNHVISPTDLSAALEQHEVGAIVGVHLWGHECDTDALERIAADHGVPLILDAAHAFGTTHRGRPTGTSGRAEVFSFHATKFVNSFEGGVITTDDDALADELELLRNFGFAGYDLVESGGINAKMSEVSAAMGLTSIEAMDRFIAHNRHIYEVYRGALGDLPGVRLVGHDAVDDQCNFQYIVLELADGSAIDRDELARVLWAENVFVRKYFAPGCHRAAPFADLDHRALPHTDDATRRVLCLPTGTALSEQEALAISSIIRLCLENANALRGGLDRAAASRSSGSLDRR